jgi:hypothetical protein
MDDFSDDGWDDINDNVLQELENNAIQFTQAQKFAQSQLPNGPPRSSAYEFGFEDDDLDDAVVIDESAPALVGAAVHIQPNPTWHQPPKPSSTAGPRPIPPPPLPSQRARPHPQASQQPSYRQNLSGRPILVPSSYSRQAPPDGDALAALQAQVSALQSELTSAKGEAAILRSKYDKSQINHDAEVARLKKQNSEQLAKQERIAEAAIAAEQHVATELQFVHLDLKEELGRAKSRRKDGVTTPKKNKNWGGGDGFDELEILPSPSKAQGQKRREPGPVAGNLADRTPTKGKRKRPLFESPVTALETHSDDLALPAQSPTLLVTASHQGLPFDVSLHERPR